jgi:hypothetical protein
MKQATQQQFETTLFSGEEDGHKLPLQVALSSPTLLRRSYIRRVSARAAVASDAPEGRPHPYPTPDGTRATTVTHD